MKLIIITLLTFFASYSLHAQNSPLTITHLTGNFYVYVTHHTLDNGQSFPSNSMYLVTDAGIVMFDTPWDSTQFQPLLDSMEMRHHKKVVLCIATHFHSDRTAGLDFLKGKGVKTYTSKMTYDLCKAYNEPQAEFYFTKDTTFTVGEYSFQTFYPGAGHTEDNIVIWLPQDKILYGGCFVKSSVNNDLGNIADANLTAWPVSVTNTIQKFPQPKYVIPGHFSWQSRKALEHTLRLLKKAENKKQ